MRNRDLALILGFAFLTPLGGVAQSPVDFERVEPASVGMSAEGLQRVTEGIQAHIDAGDIAGAVAAVVRDGKLAYLEALGYRDLEAADPMPTDALFRTYSMTRPVTALGIVMLHDEGALDVNDPVQMYLPQFADQEVLRNPASLDPEDSRPRQGDVTIAQLLTHTSGIGSRSSELYRNHSVHGWDQTLEQVVDNVARLPLFEDPGTIYRYGMHSEVLGRVIEEVSGLPLEQFYQERIFGPLGMTDTVFRVVGERRERLATVYRPDEGGQLRPHEMETIPVTEERALTSSGVGLVSSTMDFVRFSQLFLDDGVVNGERLISSEAVRMMAENGVPDDLLPLRGATSGYWAGSGWSLGGFAVAMDPSTYGHTVSPDEFWWDGSAGTRFWIDPHENMVTIINAQVSPASGNGFRENFKTLVYEAIEDRRAP